jgi:hypothetical protein
MLGIEIEVILRTDITSRGPRKYRCTDYCAVYRVLCSSLRLPLVSERISYHGLRVGESNYPRINVWCKVHENTHQCNVLANKVNDRSGRSISLFHLELVVVTDSSLLVRKGQGTLLPSIFVRFIRPSAPKRAGEP